MDEFEKALKAALEREQAPSGFANRVLARVEPPPHATWYRWRAPAARWAIATVLLAACIAVGTGKYRAYQRARGEHARTQVLLALRITGSKLRAVRVEVAKTTRER
jgi:hypothetical protein